MLLNIDKKYADLEAVNAQFNADLQRHIDGTLPKNHIYRLGNPGKILLSAGIRDLPIELSADRLAYKASENYHHTFHISEVKNLPKAINSPLAVFAYGDRTKAINIITEMEKNGKNFLAGIALNPEVNGKTLNIHSIRTVFPKDTFEWINWINQDKALYVNKEKVLGLLLANSRLPEDVAKTPALIQKINDFQNPFYT